MDDGGSKASGKMCVPELEQVILGSIILDGDLIHDIDPDWFGVDAHIIIARLIKDRIAAGKGVGPHALSFEVKSFEEVTSLGGGAYLVRMAGAASTIGWKDNIAELKNLWARRMLSTELADCTYAVENFQPFEPLDKTLGAMEKAIHRVSAVASSKPLVETALSGMTDALRQSFEAMNSDGVVGTPTGLRDLDAKVGGMAPGDMITLAGRPSMGKTAIALGIAWKAARSGVGVFFGSLEMTKAQIWTRFLSMEMEERGVHTPYFDLRTGRIQQEQIELAAQIAKEREGIPFLTGEKECRNIARLRSASRRAQAIFEEQGTPLGLIVIDYLQLIEGEPRQSDYARVSAASNAIKGMALDMAVPVLALSQLNRGVEQRDNKMPRLSDLRESGKVEEDSDIVMLAYREAYYLSKEIEDGTYDGDELVEKMADLAACKHSASLIIPKARGGPTGSVDIGFRPETNFLYDLGV